MSANNEFSNDLFNVLSEKQDNLFFSGYSISTSLGMTAAGAAGDTEKALCKLLHVSIDAKTRNDEYATLVEEVDSVGQPYDLVTANALWMQEGVEFNREFVKTVAGEFQGTFDTVDYVDGTEDAVKRINIWTAINTRNKIKEIVTVDVVQNAKLVLTNAIYFKGNWTNPFEDTYNGAFHSFSGDNEATLMLQSGRYDYFENDAFQVVDLPYEGNTLSMLVVLPKGDDSKSLTEVENTFDYESLKLNKERVNVTLPKFKLETEFKLKGPLATLGAGVIFSDDADFSGIADGLKISEVIHKAFVEVNETGTEAAAVTGVVMRCTSAMPLSPKMFKADRPFLFFIRNKKTGTILFQGHLKSIG